MFKHVDAYAGDPILTLNEDFQKDPRQGKINLSIGIYFDEEGRLPVMDAVRQAETALLGHIGPKPYLPMSGAPDYRQAIQHLLFGAQHEAVTSGRIATIQTIGGSGALKVGGDFLKRYFPNSQVWVSDPTWDNHRAMFEGAGFTVNTYPYYDAATCGYDAVGMLAHLRTLPRGSIVLLHACAHNPTGVDPSAEQWAALSGALRRHVVMFDCAYQGFASGDADRDAASIRRFVADGHELLLAQSFAKNFGLYGERVGALSVVCSDAAEAKAVESQLKRAIRPIWSNPPAYGARLVAGVLDDAALAQQWTRDCATMAERIGAMRAALRAALEAEGSARDWAHVTDQIGMFCYTGMSEAEVDRLRDEHHVYCTRDGRISMAGVTTENVGRLAAAMRAVCG